MHVVEASDSQEGRRRSSPRQLGSVAAGGLRKLLPARFRPIGYLTHLAGARAQGQVLSGPFAGMRYVDVSVGSCFIPKLLGTYERELARTIESICGRQPKLIIDTGSVDDTWEIVGDLASSHDRLRLLGKDAVYFSETRLRGWMFHQARRHMADGDWFLRADADEFHHIPPPEFVRSHLRRHETIVFHQYYDFRLTAAEVQAWQAGKETPADRARPIEERRRWFTVTPYSEPRLCRYRTTMRWPPTVSFPFNAGFRARARLPIRHYPHRDPLQLERRCRLRAAMMAEEENRRHWSRPDAHHWSMRDWRSFIVPEDHPGLQQWQPGSPLPKSRFTDHLAKPPVRAAQRLAHACLLPILDRLRAEPSCSRYPQRIRCP